MQQYDRTNWMGGVSTINTLTDCSTLTYTQAESSRNLAAGWYVKELQNPEETQHTGLTVPNPWSNVFTCSGTTA